MHTRRLSNSTEVVSDLDSDVEVDFALSIIGTVDEGEVDAAIQRVTQSRETTQLMPIIPLPSPTPTHRKPRTDETIHSFVVPPAIKAGR